VSRAVTLTLLARAVQVLSGFAGAVVSARFLGPTARGEYFFVVTASVIVVQFTNLGLSISNTYKVGREPELFGALVANAVWTSVVLGVAGALAAIAFLRGTDFFPAANSSMLWFIVALAPAMLAFLYGTNLLIGTGRIRVFNLFETFGNLLVVGALVIAGVAGGGVAAYLATSASAWGLVSAVLLIYLIRVSRARLVFDRSVFRSGLRYATKVYLVSLLAYLTLRGNVFLLQRYYGARELGYYSVAAQVGDALAIFPATVALVLFPNLVRNEHTRWRSTVRAALVVAAILAATCGVAAIVAPWFMRVAFGPAFVPGAQVLRLMLPGVFGLGMSAVLSSYLGAIGMPRITVGIWAIGVVVTLGLGRLLIPGHAGAGAAATLSITYCLVLVLIAGVVYHYRDAARRDDGVPGVDGLESPAT
jgi:O-antigen/teichoic acid export membrane protein